MIPTRGDVDLASIFASYEGIADEVLVWDNSQRKNFSVYARYAMIAEAKNDVILTQDDDCTLPLESLQALVDAYEPGRLVANMPRSRWQGYPDSALVGWGAIFDRELPGMAFRRFSELKDGWLADYADGVVSMLGERGEIYLHERHHEWFRLTCDVAFSALTPRTVIDVPFAHLPWAEGPDRMFTGRPTHSDERQRMLELCREIRGEDDDRRDW